MADISAANTLQRGALSGISDNSTFFCSVPLLSPYWGGGGQGMGHSSLRINFVLKYSFDARILGVVVLTRIFGYLAKIYKIPTYAYWNSVSRGNRHG